ncbi:MAG: isochorismatase family protein [Psychrobium sp.]
MLERNNCGLMIVDVQGALARKVYASDQVINNIARLTQCARILDLPIIWLEQYPTGLGHTVPEITEHLGGVDCLEKSHFCALTESHIVDAVDKTNKKQWLVTGIEAHICVYQTVAAMLEGGFHVEVVSDGVSSRVNSNLELALTKMTALGATLTSVEMAVYELLKRAGTDEFKQILPVIK